jgi:hypothetical protein
MLEAEAEQADSKLKRSVAIGRTNFRPAKRSAATGRIGFRPAKRSADIDSFYNWVCFFNEFKAKYSEKGLRKTR